MRRVAALTVALADLALIAGCGSGESSNEQSAQFCTPGDVASCGCPGGGAGTQVCREDGLGLSACEGCPGSAEGGEDDSGQPGPDGSDATSPSDSTFDSAAEGADGGSDGQVLGDASTDDTGAMGDSGSDGGSDVGGDSPDGPDGSTAETLASSLDFPSGLVATSSSLILNSLDGVRVISKTGGSPTPLGTAGDGSGWVAVDSANAYWTTGLGLMQSALAGGPVTVLTSGEWGTHGNLVTTGGNVLYGYHGSIRTVPIGGGAPAQTLLALPNDGGTTSDSYGLAIDSQIAYFAAVGATTAVMTGSVSGSVPTILTASHSPQDVAVDADSVYWTTQGAPGFVIKTSRTGGGEVALASNPSGVTRLAIDAGFVYWTSKDDGTISRVAKGGGTPSVVASGEDSPLGIAVDATWVYWTNHGSVVNSGSLRRVAK